MGPIRIGAVIYGQRKSSFGQRLHPRADLAGRHMEHDETGMMGASTEELYSELLMDVPLGDLMRGERATMGKSLQDVEVDLRIRASYVAAIENADLTVFTSRGFVAGYVRSYARYLGLDPEWVFSRFCEETGFSGVSGFSPEVDRTARSPQKIEMPKGQMGGLKEDRRFSKRHVLYDMDDGFFPRLEAGALGSLFVLSVVLLGVGYGAWVLLNDFQRVQFAPVADTPVALTALDPLPLPQNETSGLAGASPSLPAEEDTRDSTAMERLYRPTLLEAPVMVPRDRAISTLNPSTTGAFARDNSPVLRPDDISRAIAAAGRARAPTASTSNPPVTQEPRDQVVLFAVRPSWIRVTMTDGTVLFEGTLNAGDSYTVPVMDEMPVLRAGNSSALYFALNSVTFGPAGEGSSVIKDVPISADEIQTRYSIANAAADPQLPEVVQLVLERLAQGE